MRLIKTAFSHYQKLNIAVKASLWFTVSSFVRKGMSVITLPIFTRLMPLNQYGAYSLFQTWYNIFYRLLTLSVHEEIFNRGLILHQDEMDIYTSSQANLLLFMELVAFAVYVVFHRPINALLGLNVWFMLMMFLEIYSSGLVGLWSTRKRFDFDYRKIAVLTLTIAFLNPLLGVPMVVVSRDKALARVIANALPITVIALLLLRSIRKDEPPFAHREWWKSSVISGLPLLPHYLSLVLLNQSDKVMIGRLVNEEAVALYSVAHSCGFFMVIFNDAIHHSFLPWSYGKLKADLNADIRKVSAILCFISALAVLSLVWLAPELICLFSPLQYAEAMWCVPPIAIASFFTFVYALFIDVEIYYGKNFYTSIATVCAAILNIVLNLSAIPQFGYVAAAYTTLISYFITMLMHYVFYRRVLKRSGARTMCFHMGAIAFFSVALLILSALAMSLYDRALIRLGIVGAFVILSIIFALFLMRGHWEWIPIVRKAKDFFS